MIESNEIEARLDSVWEALAHETRSFRLVADVQRCVSQVGERRIVLPVCLIDAAHRAGVALIISEQDAKNLASVMFDLPHDQLTPSDIDDACGEACNIFSGCLVQYLLSGYLADVGLPEAMALQGYREISLASGIKALFEAGYNARRLTVILFDPLAEYRTVETT
jgi:hypothetical protein